MAYKMHGFAAKHRPKRSVWKIVFGGIAVLLVVVLVAGLLFWRSYQAGLRPVGGTGAETVAIEQGDSVQSIAKKLKLHLKNIASISIDRVYPNGIKVLITGAPILFDTTITGIPEKKW